MNQQTQQLYAGIAYSYGEYIHAYMDLINNSMFFSTAYLDAETEKFQEELKQYFLKLPELIAPKNPEKEACTIRLLEIREQLEIKYRTLIAYQRELTLLLTMRQNDPAFIDHYFELIGLDEVTPEEINFEQLASDCVQYIFKGTSGTDKQKRAASLLPYIPIRITKDNYIQYVKSSIQHIAIPNQTANAEYLMTILDQLFDGKTYSGYGQHFVDLKDSLEHLHTLRDTETLFEEADLLNETIENCMEMLEKMFRMICTFSNLLIFDKLEFNELTEMHAAFFDLYYSLKNILLKTEDYQLLQSTLPERLEDIEKELLEDYQKANQSVDPGSLFALIQTYLKMNMKQIFGFSTAKHSAYSKDVLDFFDRFASTLKEKLNALPNLERKYRMQYFLSQIPFVMSEANFDAYIHQAFRNISNFKPYLLVANQLSNILEENHFYPEAKPIPVMDQSYEEDDEAARFIAEHADLFKDEDTLHDPFFGNDSWLPK